MKFKKVLKISMLAVMFVALAGYVLYAMTSMSGPDPDEICRGVVLEVEDNGNADFVDKAKVESLLKSQNLYPVGRKCADIDTRSIEDALKRNPFIERVECYKASDGKFCIKVYQRTPVMYVMPAGKDGYFIDANGEIIPNTSFASNIVVATGDIDKKYAVKELVPFGVYLQNDEFWNNQIEQINVFKDREHQRVVELVPRVGEHIVYMGKMEGFEKKLKRLKTFYRKAMGQVGWNKYVKINLEYDNQIICTKK